MQHIGVEGFYSLSCETYSGTTTRRRPHRPRVDVSIRCRARRTAEHLADNLAEGDRCKSFYSLSCETYSGTVRVDREGRRDSVSIRCRARRTAERDTPPASMTVRLMFLFAVVRDVQRNRRRRGRRERDGSIVSIRCRARRTAEPALADPSDLIGLFPIEGVGPDFAVVGASVRG